VSDNRGQRPDLSVVLPSYNSAAWLPSTLEACATALQATRLRSEVVVVDDGSSDDTAPLVREMARTFPVPLRLLEQENRGRFLARWAGLQDARGDRVLLLDSRVLLEPGSLAHVEATVAATPAATVWNGHCTTDPAAPLVGHFWEVITYAFWGGYLRTPGPVQIDEANYNQFPKGTGVFLAPRDVLIQACRASWPTGDAALASDDTKVLRHIARSSTIRLDPGFRAIYRPRGNVRDFVRHSFGRGTFLVDSFGGSSVRWNTVLIGLALMPALVLAVLGALLAASAWTAVTGLVAGCLLALVSPAVVAARNGCPARGLRAFLTYAPVFAAPYWAGLVRGLFVHGHHLRSTRRNLVAEPGTAS
jgi:glycosyltransferase involved in cell wall biosynthesis